MILSAEWAKAYEQEYGHKPTEMAQKMVAHLDQASKTFKELGKKHASQGEPTYGTAAFRDLAAKAFHLHPAEDQETVLAVADLWQSAYMNAYNSVKGGLQDV